VAGYREKWRGRLMAAGGDMRRPAAQAAILEALCAGDYPESVEGSWFPVELKHGPYTAIVRVSSDAMKIGTATDYTRPLVTHRTQQAAADILGLVVPTRKIEDAMIDQASMQVDAAGSLIPGKRKTGTQGTGQDFIRPESASGNLPATVAVQDEESERMDAMARKLVGMPDPVIGLGFNEIGKTWISSGRLQSRGSKSLGINHGFPSKIVRYGYRTNGSRYPLRRTSGGWYLIQDAGGAHNLDHTDYSQRARFAHRQVAIKGGQYGDDPTWVDIDQLATDPDTAGLFWAAGEAPAPVRHPWLSLHQCAGGGGGGSGEGMPPPPLDPPADPSHLPWGQSSPGQQPPPVWPWLASLGLFGLAWYASR